MLIVDFFQWNIFQSFHQQVTLPIIHKKFGIIVRIDSGLKGIEIKIVQKELRITGTAKIYGFNQDENIITSGISSLIYCQKRLQKDEKEYQTQEPSVKVSCFMKMSNFIFQVNQQTPKSLTNKKRRCLSLEISQFLQKLYSLIASKIKKNMFSQTLNPRLLSSSKSLKHLINPQQSKSLDLTDLQFQLCSNFLKLTKQKLYQQEAEMLAMNESLMSKVSERAITKVSERAFSGMSGSLKDVSSQDTTMFSFQGQEEQDAFSQSCKSMLILRKSKSNACMRRTQTDFSSLMREIQNKCSQRTAQSVSTLIEQNKRLKEKNGNIQKKEKQFRKKQIEYEKDQEQIFVLKKKAAEYDKVINSMHAQIAALKMRLKQTQCSLKRSKSPTHDLTPVTDNQITAKNYLSQKQLVINESTKQLRQLYLQVQNKLQQPFNQGACDKCCQMIKKIKGSILKYRELMEAEANAMEGLYEKFRVKIK